METQSILTKPVRQSYINNVLFGILSMVGTSLFILADTFFVANGVGSEGIAALNIVLPMINIFNGLGWMLGAGGATLFSIQKGRGKVSEAQKNFTFTILLAFIIGIVFSLVAFLFKDQILPFLGANGSIYAMSDSYYSIITVFAILFILNNVFITFLRNDNSPQLAMTALMIGGLVNIVLDYIFVFPLQMGLAGAALATCVSPIVSLLISSLHLKNKNRQLKFRSINKQWKIMPQVFSLGMPSFLNEFSSAFITLLFNVILIRLLGNIGVSAYGIIANMNIVVIALFTGVGQGFQPLVSVFYGAGEKGKVKQVLKYALITTIGMGLLFFAIGLIFPDMIVNIFNSEQNQDLEAIAVTGIRLYFSSFLFTGINFAVSYFMSAIGKARPSLTISLLRGLLLIVPVLFIMTALFNVNGVWLTMLVVELLTLAVSIYVLYSYNKQFL